MKAARAGRASFEIVPIGIVGRILIPAELADKESLSRIFRPEFVPANAEIIAVIFEEFFEARSPKAAPPKTNWPNGCAKK
jgi:hypothetical protein